MADLNGVNVQKKRFADVDLVFMDPDNGLLVDSVGKRSARSVKDAFADMKNSKWGQCGVCRLYPEDADAAFTVCY